MKKTARIAISALAAAFVILTGVLLSPAAQADPPPGYEDATDVKAVNDSACGENPHVYMGNSHYCLKGNIKGQGQRGWWYWDDQNKVFTFDNFELVDTNLLSHSTAGLIFIKFDVKNPGTDKVTVKFKGNNLIKHREGSQSNLNDGLALGLEAETPLTFNLEGETPDSTLTLDAGVADSKKPNSITGLRCLASQLNIGGEGTLNLNTEYNGSEKFGMIAGIDFRPKPSKDGGKVNISGNAKLNINSNPNPAANGNNVFGIFALTDTAVAGNSQVNIDLKGPGKAGTIGIYSAQNVNVTEKSQLTINVTSKESLPIGIMPRTNANFSTAKDTSITTPGGRAIHSYGSANFFGPGDVIGSGSTGSSLRADGGINFADGYGVYLPVAGSAVNPGVADKAGKKVGAWRLSMLPPKYEEVKTEPGKAVKSPVKTTTYTKDAANATTVTYSAPETVDVNGKPWKVAIDATTGELTVTPHEDARKGDRAEIPVTLSYANDIFPADAKAKSEVGSNEAGIKKRIAIAPVVVEPIATPETPTAQDYDQVKEGNWQELVMPSYDPDEEGKPNPLAGMFSYDLANVKYLNHAGQPFNPKDPVSRGKKAEVIVPLTKKGKENFSKMKCPADTLCELLDDGTVKFTVILDYKERSEKPDTPCKPCKPCGDPGTVPGGQQPGTHPGTTPGGTQPGTKITNGTKGNSTPTPDSLVRTGAVDTAILGFGASVLLLVGFALLRRRHS